MSHMEDEPHNTVPWGFIPALASSPFVCLTVHCAYNALWYQFATEAAGARGDHPYVFGFTMGFLVSAGLSAIAFLVPIGLLKLFSRSTGNRT